MGAGSHWAKEIFNSIAAHAKQGNTAWVTDTELEVVLAPMSPAHSTRAVAALTEELTAQAAVFSGSKLRLRYRVAATV